MERRLELHERLCELLGSRNVYFQPPETVKMHYPCIVYQLASLATKWSNNYPYDHRRRYTITIIDANPDSELPQQIKEWQLCSFDRFFVSDNLNHFVFSIYY